MVVVVVAEVIGDVDSVLEGGVGLALRLWA